MKQVLNAIGQTFVNEMNPPRGPFRVIEGEAMRKTVEDQQKCLATITSCIFIARELQVLQIEEQ